jgi:hypothetical protein
MPLRDRRDDPGLTAKMQIDHKMVNLASGVAVSPLRWSLTGRNLCINDVWNCIVAMQQ